MTVDDDLRTELIEYLEAEMNHRLDRWHRLTIEHDLIRGLQEGNSDQGFYQQVYDYLAKDFDVNWEGGPNTPMQLAGQMTFEDDYKRWHPLWEAEKKAGLLDPPDPEVIDEYGRKR